MNIKNEILLCSNEPARFLHAVLIEALENFIPSWWDGREVAEGTGDESLEAGSLDLGLLSFGQQNTEFLRLQNLLQDRQRELAVTFDETLDVRLAVCHL